jgi:hypothetical protein
MQDVLAPQHQVPEAYSHTYHNGELFDTWNFGVCAPAIGRRRSEGECSSFSLVEVKGADETDSGKTKYNEWRVRKVDSAKLASKEGVVKDGLQLENRETYDRLVAFSQDSLKKFPLFAVSIILGNIARLDHGKSALFSRRWKLTTA